MSVANNLLIIGITIKVSINVRCQFPTCEVVQVIIDPAKQINASVTTTYVAKAVD